MDPVLRPHDRDRLEPAAISDLTSELVRMLRSESTGLGSQTRHGLRVGELSWVVYGTHYARRERKPSGAAAAGRKRPRE